MLKLLAIGGVVSISGLTACSGRSGASARVSSPAAGGAALGVTPATEDFVFLQLSDTHWGYRGANNPEANLTLRAAIDQINASPLSPDFVVFTGDLTQVTPDRSIRKRRMVEFKELVGGLKIKMRYFIPGEHDAGPDHGDTYRELFGDSHASFDHKGVHFVLLDNVSAEGSTLGEDQLEWLANDLARVAPVTPVVAFAHRPLFPLLPSWDWTTSDGGRAIELLQKRPLATVFYGHIHQQHHATTGRVHHYAARSLIFPMPAPGSVPVKEPAAWDPTAIDHGLGYRVVREQHGAPSVDDRVLATAPRRTATPEATHTASSKAETKPLAVNRR